MICRSRMRSADYSLVGARLLSIFALSIVVVACKNQIKEDNTSSFPPPVQVDKSNFNEAPPPVVKTTPLEERLLRQAQKAFRSAQYTSPSHNNAYDKFKSVLLINPKNSQARAGLQAILLKYAQLVRTSLKDGRIRSADQYLKLAESYYPANGLLKELRDNVRAKKNTLTVHNDSFSEKEQRNYEELRLSIADLNAKSEAIISLLADLASRLKDTDESVLIYARSDREGRWIYRQLKEAAQGYRVRGDIRVSRSPKVRILPPL